jgi:hypothetical protein
MTDKERQESIEKTTKLLQSEKDREKRTQIFIDWLRIVDDRKKQRYFLNCGMAHSLFNISCKYFKEKDIQNIDFHFIHSNMMACFGKWEREL